MKIVVGSDERSHLTDFVLDDLRRRGLKAELFGPLSGNSLQWVDVAEQVAERISRGEVEQGILFCWTGTGVALVANKLPGVRATLCGDSETARGARAWNESNLLCISLRSTSETAAAEILNAWFSTQVDPSEAENIKKMKDIDERYRVSASGRRMEVEANG